MFKIFIDRDVEKTHGMSFQFGGQKGVSFRIQWRSWQNWMNGYDPWMLSFSCFVWGTFLWANPHAWDSYWARQCCSNGITLFHWTAIRPMEESNA